MTNKSKAILALILLLPLPTLGTIAGMIHPATRGTALGQAIYLGSKFGVFLIPLIWIFWVDRMKPSLSPIKKGGLPMGLLSGIFISGVIFGVYAIFGDSLIQPEVVQEQARKNGLANFWMYMGLSCYLILINSLLEEFVWRWFVFKKIEIIAGSGMAVFLSACGFTLHHVFALSIQFGVAVTVLGSLGVFIGGLIWSYFYQKYRSIWPGYLSHALVDVAILVIGWQLIFG